MGKVIAYLGVPLAFIIPAVLIQMNGMLAPEIVERSLAVAILAIGLVAVWRQLIKEREYNRDRDDKLMEALKENTAAFQRHTAAIDRLIESFSQTSDDK